MLLIYDTGCNLYLEDRANTGDVCYHKIFFDTKKQKIIFQYNKKSKKGKSITFKNADLFFSYIEKLTNQEYNIYFIYKRECENMYYKPILCQIIDNQS